MIRGREGGSDDEVEKEGGREVPVVAGLIGRGIEELQKLRTPQVELKEGRR